MTTTTIFSIVELNDLVDMEDLVDDFVTFYVAGIIAAETSIILWKDIPFLYKIYTNVVQMLALY